jgi:hypothetical protein
MEGKASSEGLSWNQNDFALTQTISAQLPTTESYRARFADLRFCIYGSFVKQEAFANSMEILDSLNGIHVSFVESYLQLHAPPYLR